MSTPPPRRVHAIEGGFWNIRGSFKPGGLVDVGTQASLVRLADGSYVFLDTYTLTDDVRRWVDAETDGGRAIAAVINLHPFHTLHVEKLHATYPEAKLYGTARHHRKLGALPWEPELVEDEAFGELFADDFDFSVPRGVELIPDDENLHFSSVLAFHRASKTLHVDDTLCYARLPKIVRAFQKDMLRFHPTLGKVLEKRAGAVADFRAWVDELVERSADLDNLCTAHTSSLLKGRYEGPPIADRVVEAYRKVEGKLRRHEARYG